jgi:nitroreductase
MGFVDDSVDKLLHLEDKKEAAIAIAALGTGLSLDNTSARQQQQAELGKIEYGSSLNIRPLSKSGEINYPEIWELNRASSLSSKEEVMQWINNAHTSDYLLARKSYLTQEKRAKHDVNSLIPDELREEIKDSISLTKTILQRGSSRRFARSAISLSTLKTILYSSTRGVPMDILSDGNSLIDIYFIANAIDGLTPGAYFYNRNADPDSNAYFNKIKQIAASRKIAAYLCLGQSLFGEASAVFFLLTDLRSVLASLGNRGYRACQFEAGIIAGKIYLAAYALGIGASGSTFFDDAVTEFLSPHATNKNTMIAVGVGVPAYKSRPGKILPVRLTKEQLLRYDFN